MPPWLKVIAHFNPLSYIIDGMRFLMVGTASTYSLPIGYVVLTIASIVLVAIGGRLYKRIII